MPTRVPVRWKARLSDPMPIAVLALGITQITAWGTSFYCLGVLAGPISQDTHWSRGFVFLGFTVALLVMGVVSSAVGAYDRPARRAAVTTLGSVLVAGGLFALAHVHSEPAYLAVWAFLGVGMRMCLYDAAFAALVQVAPSRGRTAISYLTLFGAFASSVFWVVGHALNQRVGWRQTLLVRLHGTWAVCLPLHWFGLSRREPPRGEATPTGGPAPSREDPPLEGRTRSRAIVLFALSSCPSTGSCSARASVQLVPLLEAAGLATAAAVWVASLKGVAQFGGRVVEMLFGRKLRAITVARIAVGVLPPSLLLLMVGPASLSLVVAFTLLDGSVPGCDHDRPWRGPARPVRFQGLRCGPGCHRHAGPDRECRIAFPLCLDHGSLGVGNRTDVTPGWCGSGLAGHGDHVALVRGAAPRGRVGIAGARHRDPASARRSTPLGFRSGPAVAG